MEGTLTARDKVGVQDFVLLDAYTSESAFLENLRKRFRENLIYTYIGTLLVSVNPYQELGIYTASQMELYQGVNFFELPPHVYAVADNAYRMMCSELNNHFILISGESGAGKTEASKKILQYFAVTCPMTESLQIARDRLLLSIPILEGVPVGGHIISYLIEKSRVVYQNHGERNFHIFYQLLAGGEVERLTSLGLEQDPQLYKYLSQGHCTRESPINDKNDWKTVSNAFSVIDFTEADLEVICPLTVELSVYARDAMAKAVYGRTFTWLVNKINSSLVNKDFTQKTVIGLLDIYGFEVFDKNGFEQFCINYCNEKLQQLLIERTLKAEQAEYESEGIEWEPVQYFNNKIICDLVEERHRGIMSILVGYYHTYLTALVSFKADGNDPQWLALDFSIILAALEEKGSSRYVSVSCSRKLAGPKGRKRIGWLEFCLLHYAGEVTYSTKVRNVFKCPQSKWLCCLLVSRSDAQSSRLVLFTQVLCRSKNSILRECFLVAELENRRRPPTVGTQFKNSLSSLLELLISKEPSYIRCIKPNERKEPSKFDDFLISHQIKYLGLMEHLRVRRAGFAYRRKYEHFLQRYKSLCPDTWPHWHGPPGEGVERLIKYIGYQPQDYKLGNSGLFSATTLEAHWRGALARREIKRRKWAVQIIRRFIKGFINRGRPLCPDNEEFVVLVRRNYILNLRYHVPKNVLDKSWLRPPGILENMQQRVVTSDIFKGKKDGYEDSLNQPFASSRLGEGNINPKVLQLLGSEKIQYGVPVIKYDRKGFKARQRQLLLTSSAAYVVELSKIKQKIEYSALRGVSTSSLSDGILVIHVSPGDKQHKGDAILQCEHVFEVATKLAMLIKKEHAVRVVQGR
ncbi:Myosin-Ih [Cricetulus griseus]|uniref:Myosin-Ih n=1 Tax=Cricetulus griseus TaxID=10029 RepID=G3HI83_CRIGR|nr:Myosin-Ih [Cricetulus griseus]